MSDTNAPKTKFVAIVLIMSAYDFTHLSRRNSAFGRQTITVANGAKFVALKMSEAELLLARDVLYLHVSRKN